MHLSLIGPGRLGQAVARRLCEAGYAIEAVIGRDGKRAAEAARFIGAFGRESTDFAAAAGSEVVLLAVPDDALAATAARLIDEKVVGPGSVLAHFSGIHRADILLGETDRGETGIDVLSIHPLQTFADPQRGYVALPGTPCAVEGQRRLLPLAEKIVADLGGTPFRLASEHKALYHAAACIASNYLVTLAAASEEVLAGCGLSAGETRKLLGPLLQTTAGNIAEVGPTRALTGPIARGDTRTVARHLDALSEHVPAQAELYRLLGRMTIQVGLQKGTLDAAAAQELGKLLD